MDSNLDSAIAFASFSDAGEFAAATKPAEISCVQTRRGGFQLDWTGLRIGHMAFQFMALPIGSVAAIGETAPQDQSFHVPLGVPQRISIMGHAAADDQIAAYDPRSEHAVCGAEGARLVYIGPAPHALDTITPLLFGFDYKHPGKGNYLVSSRAELMQRLRGHLEDLLVQSTATPQAILHPEVGKNIEATTLELLLTVLAPELVFSPQIGRQPISRESVLGRIDDCLRQKPHEPVYVSDLCSAAQVSQPTLYRIFQDLFAIGPKQFLQIRRLHQVRTRLLDGDPSTETVSAVAYDFGFWQLGRFARDYKAFFGEAPSETLKHKRALDVRAMPKILGRSAKLGWASK